MCYSALLRKQYKDLEKRFGHITVRTDMEFVQDEWNEPPGRAAASSTERVFPGLPGTVLWRNGGVLTQEKMIYGAHVPEHIPAGNAKSLTTYNARFDNLDSKFWQHAFLKRHGVVWLDGFFEWVAVSDLLEAGVVTLEHARARFALQANERKLKRQAQGKPFKPSKTELTDARFRKIEIQFQPAASALLLVPIIISEQTLEDRVDRRFAIITDDPPPKVAAAGHDRCPVLLSVDGAALWLSQEALKRDVAYAALAQRVRTQFTHLLPDAA